MDKYTKFILTMIAVGILGLNYHLFKGGIIFEARNVCKKIGVTPGTDKFIDCTIKMMSTSSGQQTVIVGQRKRTSIYPLHCRQMGGASNC